MKKGLVLEGGGTKGAYQIGAYKALRDLGIKFTGIAGTSIGALNGALIIQDDDKVMEDIWINYDYKSFMNIDEDTYERYKNIEMKAKNFHDVVDLINKARKNNGIDISPLRKLLQEKIDEDKIRQSNIDFGITTAYWDGKIFPKLLYTEDIPKGRLADYLIASASLPIFQLDKLDDKLYLDGMFSDNIPINMLAQKGYNDIVVIRLVNDSIGKKIINKYKDLNLKLIVPSQDLGGSLNKDKEHIETNVKLGYLDTMKAYKRYDGVKYFFNLDCKYNEDYCFNKISNLNLDTNPISKALGRGVHTTRHVELFKFNNSLIADTPGFSSLDLKNLTKEDIRNSFIEFGFDCEYKDCYHLKEQNCSVKERVLSGEIRQSRYDNYVKLVKENESIRIVYKK